MFATRPTSLAFIDSNLPDINTLVAGLPAHVEYHVLHPQLPALQQMVALCADRVGLAALHLITHGAPGTLFLGGTAIRRADLLGYRAEISTLANALIEGCWSRFEYLQPANSSLARRARRKFCAGA